MNLKSINSVIVANFSIFRFLNIQNGYFVIHLKCNAIPFLESVLGYNSKLLNE